LKQNKAVFVYWVDPSSYSPWLAIEPTKNLEPMGQWSFGFVVGKTRRKLTLALTYADDRASVADVLVLPMGCVREIVEAKI